VKLVLKQQTSSSNKENIYRREENNMLKKEQLSSSGSLKGKSLLLLTCLVLLGLFLSIVVKDNAAIANQKTTINFSGKSYQLESSTSNGVVLVPVRQVANILGATLQWDSNSKTAVMTSKTEKIIINAAKKSANVNGKETPIDLVKLEEGRLLVPLSFVESLFKTNTNVIGIIGEKWYNNTPPGVLAQWQQSKHGQYGIGCSTCHGDDPTNIKKPSAGTCGSCHIDEYKEFLMSTHSIALEHAQSKNYAQYNGKQVEYKWQAYAPGGPDKFGCENCHNIGYIAEDNTMGDCSSCHSSHLFSLEQARSPEACNVCHAGPGHPQYESYIDSTHGKLYVTLRNKFDLSGSSKEFWARQETDPIPTPLCISCHMPQGTHNTRDGMAHDLYGQRVKDYEHQVDLMVNNCTTCHTENYARTWLGYADGVAKVTLARRDEARDMLTALRKEGLLRPTMEVTNSHPIAGQLSGVEKLFFDVGMAGNRARKGAYHMSPLWSGRLGWTDQSFALMEFRSEVDRLRREAELEKKLLELEKQLAK
jgi:hypothetical protein